MRDFDVSEGHAAFFFRVEVTFGFWIMTPYSIVCRYRRFGGIFCLLLQSGSGYGLLGFDAI
jgi:hypothetical protein